MTPRESMVIVETLELPQISLWTRLPATYRPTTPPRTVSLTFKKLERQTACWTQLPQEFYIRTSSGADALHRRCCPLKILPGVMRSLIEC